MRLLRSLILLLALAPPAGLAQAAPAPPPLGSDGHGVRLVQRGHPARLVILLSPKRYRAVAGKELVVVCAPVPQTTLGGQVVRPRTRYRGVPRPPGGAVARLHPPRRRAPLVTRLAPDWDWCAMTVRKVRHHGNSTSVAARDVATVPLTAAGAAFADERRVAIRVIVTAFTLDLMARLRRRPRGLSVRSIARFMHAVVLASPLETPPPDRLGLYTDGRRHHYAAQADPAGELLFYEQDGDVTRTNLLRYLQDDSLLWGASLRR
jgi:hypothetical protein